ncbi:nitrogen permease regulator 2 [Endogone sp. FLAS-F59071]|nr:nitrogen permease regulator 2 [Endogone sp. FLAS-F59071]|eukprot:RUS23469.1 nitrogen permease regulator 2 [Endogone sp. FLAS-F59071]
MTSSTAKPQTDATLCPLPLCSRMEFQGFPRLHSVFYSTFDINKGPIVKYQIPEGSITPISTASPYSPSSPTFPPTPIPQVSSKTLINFEAISEYIIPKNELCERLVTILMPNYKIMGYPMNIWDPNKYFTTRNELRFNLCFVFEREAETSSYEPVVRKMAKVLQELEIEDSFLSNNSQRFSVQYLIEQLLEDLNSYCECQISINDSNTINIKLFPTYPNPPPVHDYQVPVYTVELKQLMGVNWDITMQKIIEYINGINHVKKIAEKADVATHWARKYYGCVIMVDIFQFSNIYAVKPDVMRLMEDRGLQNECRDYVTKQGLIAPPIAKIFLLYCALKHGTTLRKWIDENGVMLIPMDIRRFISFGVIKNFLYRVHKYPILTDAAPESVRKRIPEPLLPYLDGQHHYDEICTEFWYSAREMDEVLGYRKEESALRTARGTEGGAEAGGVTMGGDSGTGIKFMFR